MMSFSEDEHASSSSFSTSSSTGDVEGIVAPKQLAETSKSCHGQELKEETYALWAWPLNEDGFVKCISGRDKFRVALDFKNLLSREADIRKFDNVKSAGSIFTFTIGLCSIKRPELYFWRLEVYLFTTTEMILVEVYREVFQDYGNVPSVRVSKRLSKVRKTYRLPEQYDITTATVNVSEELGAIVIEALPKARP